MAVTNAQIDQAVPAVGSATPHPVQPNATLTNVILKDLNTNKTSLDGVKSNLQIYIPDPLRHSVEQATGGRQTIIYTAKKQPCYMYVQPKFMLEDLPGWTAGTGVHPAFLFNGVEDAQIMVGVYQASNVGGEAVSQPNRQPWVGINYDNARAAAQASGAGFDLMSNWDWAAIALWCMANGFQPRGNTDYGRHHEQKHETGKLAAGVTIGSDATGIASIFTGTGPASWRHDGTPAGIADLVGNVWEWQTGLKSVDKRIFMANDNGIGAESSYPNTGFDIADASPWSSLNAAGANDKLKQALVVPSGVLEPLGRLYTNAAGERLPFRGGHRYNAGNAGLGALDLYYERTDAHSNVGFRLRFRPQ